MTVHFDAAEIDDLLRVDPDAFLLLAVLRRNQFDRKIYIPAKMHRIMPKGWHEHRLFRARWSIA